MTFLPNFVDLCTIPGSSKLSTLVPTRSAKERQLSFTQRLTRIALAYPRRSSQTLPLIDITAGLAVFQFMSEADFQDRRRILMMSCY